MIYNEGPSGVRQILYLTAFLLTVGYQTVNIFVLNADMIVATRILAAASYRVVVYACPDRRDARRRAFIDAAEELMPRKTFVELWARAAERVPTAFGDASEGRGGRMPRRPAAIT
ncbi:hypothetical protein [Methylorubrum aminovorans]